MENILENDKIYFRPPANILVVDDSHLNRSFIVNAFNSPNYSISTAVDGEEGIKVAAEVEPELILLDIMMPNMDGFNTCQLLKSNSKLESVPIIFITALDAIKDKLKAFEVGAVDFVTKPFNHKELIARVRTHVSLRRATIQKEQMLRFAMDEKRHETIARIAAGVSHNFNNMLGVSFGNIMLVESILGRDIDSVAQDALGDVKKSLERMQNLVQKFLRLTKAGFEGASTGRTHVFLKIFDLLEDVVENIESQKQHSGDPIHINNSVDPNIQILCDNSQAQEMFHLIFSEVIENTAGKAEISIKSLPKSNDRVSLELSIKNIDFPDEVKDSIFEPFALPLANVGTGLAFAVARQLVEENRGTVQASFPATHEVQFIFSFMTNE